MTVKIIDSDDVVEAVALSARDGLSPESAIEQVIHQNGRYWISDVNQLCPGCLAALNAMIGVPDAVGVICEACRGVAERVPA